MLAIIEISFRIVKAVPLHTTLRVNCEARVHSRCTDAHATQSQHMQGVASLAGCVRIGGVRGSWCLPAINLLLPASLLGSVAQKELAPLYMPCKCLRRMCASAAHSRHLR